MRQEPVKQDYPQYIIRISYCPEMCMTSHDALRIVEYESRYAEAAVTMWRHSKQKAIGQKEVHSFDDHLYFLNEILPIENSIYLAIYGEQDKVVGLLATDGQFVNQLYIHTDFQRLGIGSKLIQLAKDNSSGALQLVTFDVNVGAQAFYEKHGFTRAGSGGENEENLPALLFHWTTDEASP